MFYGFTIKQILAFAIILILTILIGWGVYSIVKYSNAGWKAANIQEGARETEHQNAIDEARTETNVATNQRESATNRRLETENANFANLSNSNLQDELMREANLAIERRKERERAKE